MARSTVDVIAALRKELQQEEQERYRAIGEATAEFRANTSTTRLEFDIRAADRGSEMRRARLEQDKKIKVRTVTHKTYIKKY